jgi:hypothetical protein
MNPYNPGDGGHGSCMLSKIAGTTLGVAKRITPIMTVINPNLFINENYLDGLQKIYDHIIENGNQGKSTLSMALNFKTPTLSQGWINRFGMLFSP